MQKILKSFSLSFLISGVYFFEFINYYFFTYTGLYYEKSEVIISFLFLHFFCTISFFLFFCFLDLFKSNYIRKIIIKIFKVFLFFFFLRILIKSTGYPGMIYFFQSTFGITGTYLEKYLIFSFLILILLLIDFFLEKKKLDTLNFFQIYGFIILILIIYNLFTNNIFQDKNLKFKNNIETKFNKENEKRVYFVVFDTMDYDFIFEENHNLNLKNLNFLKSKSAFFKNAYPPASKTLHVIPALLVGKEPKKYKIDGTFKEAYIKTPNKNIKFNFENSLFSKLKNRTELNEKNFSIIGRYHPICNIFHEINCLNFTAKFNYQTKVNWYSGLLRLCETVGEVISIIKKKDLCFVEYLRVQKSNQSTIDEITFLQKNWSQYFLRETNFSFLHILPPKPEDYMYGKEFLSDKNSFFKNKSNIIARHKKYGQNLVYADELIGKMLNIINKKEDYMLIITGDTSLMENKTLVSNRVPLIIKLKNENTEFKIAHNFNTVHIAEIILKYNENLIQNYKDIENFVSQQKFFLPLSN